MTDKTETKTKTKTLDEQHTGKEENNNKSTKKPSSSSSSSDQNDGQEYIQTNDKDKKDAENEADEDKEKKDAENEANEDKDKKNTEKEDKHKNDDDKENDELDTRTKLVIEETVARMNLNILETLSERPFLVATAVMGITTQMVTTNQTMVRVCGKLDLISQKLDKKLTTTDHRPDTQFNHALGDIRAEMRALNTNNQQQHNAIYQLGTAVRELTTTIKTNQAQNTTILTGITSALNTFGAIMNKNTAQRETNAPRPTLQTTGTNIDPTRLTNDFDQEWDRQLNRTNCNTTQGRSTNDDMITGDISRGYRDETIVETEVIEVKGTRSETGHVRMTEETMTEGAPGSRLGKQETDF